MVHRPGMLDIGPELYRFPLDHSVHEERHLLHNQGRSTIPQEQPEEALPTPHATHAPNAQGQGGAGGSKAGSAPPANVYCYIDNSGVGAITQSGTGR